MKKKILAVASILLVAAFAFAQLKDGKFSAKEPKADERGYTAEITITVKGGAITKIDYNESKAGKSSKWADAAYNANMKKVSGTAWSDAVKALEADLQKKGAPDAVDAVSGATELSARFKALAVEALAKATK
jgi:major membrane immunogen (membrane-anchored lipoprotein)